MFSPDITGIIDPVLSSHDTKKLFNRSAGILLVIVILHIIAMRWSLYWVIPWFDNLMHYLGGFWLGALTLAGVSAWFGYEYRPQLSFFVIALTGVLLVGQGWEIFELAVDHYIYGQNVLSPDITDMLTDLVFDSLGGMTSALLVYFHIFKKHEQA